MSAPRRILIVDADPDVHRVLCSALAAPDRRIESAYDALSTLQHIKGATYDLVMTDVHMPGLDGTTLIDRIRADRPGTKVVVMTSASTPEDIVHAIREHAFSYFSKPFAVNAVAEMVERALNSTSAEDDIQVLSARPNWLGLRVRCKLENGDRILQFLREMGMDLPPAEQERIAVAFREILLNAIEHGGGSDPEKRVFITYVRTKQAILYYVRDPGKGFSFDELTHAAISNPLESPTEHVEIRERLGMRPGGFGLMMTRQLVDEMIYNEAGNEVLLIKYLPNSAHGKSSS